MKIKLSKAQWQFIGKEVGWMKEAQAYQEIPSKWENKGSFDPLWNVTNIKKDVFRLSYQNVPMIDYSLKTRQDGSYDGDIKIIKNYGFNYITKVPANVRLPVILEMFSRAKDIIDKEKETI